MSFKWYDPLLYASGLTAWVPGVRTAVESMKDNGSISDKDLAIMTKSFNELVPTGKTNLSDASLYQGLNNLFTGNLDYQRTLDTLSREQSFNAIEAQKSRDYQTEMSNTAHQREVADLEAVGLNPALSLGSGGASGYSAATASSPGIGVNSAGRGFSMIAKALTGLVSATANNAIKLKQLQDSNSFNAGKLALMNERISNQKEAIDNIDAWRMNKLLDDQDYRTNLLKIYRQNSNINNAKVHNAGVHQKFADRVNYDRGFRV